jgi:hypothetical protein
MKTSFQVYALVLMCGFVSLPTSGAQYSWSASSALFPDQVQPAMTLVNIATPEQPILTATDLLLNTDESSEYMFYHTIGTNLDMPSQLVIEVELRYVSSEPSPAGPGVAIGFLTAPHVYGVLGIKQDSIYLRSSDFGEDGPSVAVDTDDSFHLYRIEVDAPTTLGSEIRVFQDGSLALTGAMIQRIDDDPPEVWFGDGSSRGYGTSRWRSFRHNAARDTTSTTVRYVNVNSATPTAPYTNWSTAATVIQDAIDVAEPGDEIVVTDGVYETGGCAVYPGMTNRVAVTKALTVRSVNGPEVTVIRGHQMPGTTNGDGAVRCAYLTNGAVLVGFRLTDGATTLPSADLIRDPEQALSGGGVWCESTNASVFNCVLTRNNAYFAGGAYSGTLSNCIVSQNSATERGGGAFLSRLLDSRVAENSVGRWAGGICYGSAQNCTLSSNRTG